jgi:hypothetical protein
VGWAGHVADKGEIKMWAANKFLLENLNGRNHLQDLYVDRRIILKWALKKIACEVVD